MHQPHRLPFGPRYAVTPSAGSQGLPRPRLTGRCKCTAPPAHAAHTAWDAAAWAGNKVMCPASAPSPSVAWLPISTHCALRKHPLRPDSQDVAREPDESPLSDVSSFHHDLLGHPPRRSTCFLRLSPARPSLDSTLFRHLSRSDKPSRVRTPPSAFPPLVAASSFAYPPQLDCRRLSLDSDASDATRAARHERHIPRRSRQRIPFGYRESYFDAAALRLPPRAHKAP